MGTQLHLILQCLHPSALGTLAESRNIKDWTNTGICSFIHSSSELLATLCLQMTG